jgi:hypothetical protein
MIKLIAGIAAVASAATVGVVIASDASSAALVASCKSRNLRPVFAGRDGAAGTLHDKWRLVNVGTSTCGVSGYPTVHNYRSDGRPLPTSTSHSGSPSSVTLDPGQHASFILSFPDPGILNCTPSPAAMMTIQTLPTELPLITSRGERACHGELDETPLVHGG